MNGEQVKEFTENAMGLIKKMESDAITNHVRQHLTVSNLLMEIDNLKNPGQSSTADDEAILEESLATSDNLSLPQDGINFTQDNHGHVVGGLTRVYIGDEVSEPISEIKIKLATEQDEATVRGNEELEELKEKFVIITRD